MKRAAPTARHDVARRPSEARPPPSRRASFGWRTARGRAPTPPSDAAVAAAAAALEPTASEVAAARAAEAPGWEVVGVVS